MASFEPRISGVRSDRSTNCATTRVAFFNSLYSPTFFQAQQSYTTFLKKEPVYTNETSSPSPIGVSSDMSDFYQPPTASPYSQFGSSASTSGADYLSYGESRSGDLSGNLPASLQGALQGALGGARNRRQMVSSTATSVNP